MYSPSKRSSVLARNYQTDQGYGKRLCNMSKVPVSTIAIIPELVSSV